jgi:hypothetical protein
VGKKSYREALFSPRPAASRDVGGWVTVVRRRSNTLKSLPRPVPVDLRGRCFNCFSSEHRAAVCRNRVRCFFCRLPGHRVGECPRRRTDPPFPGRSLVWRPVAMKPSEKNVCGRDLAVAGGSGPVSMIGEGAKKRTRRGQRKRKSGAGGQLPHPPAFGLDKPVSFVGRCGRIDRAEEELRRALIVSVVGREDSGCAVEVRDAIASRFCLEAGSLRIRRVAPNSFLVFFPSVAVADRVIGEGQSLHVPPLRLHIRRWSRQAFAPGGGQPLVPVDVELRGIPAHLWGIEAAEAVLGAFCLIHGFLPGLVKEEDMSVLRLKVWCRSPVLLPAVVDLLAEEPMVCGEDGSWVPSTLVFSVSVVVLHSDGSSDFGVDPPAPPPSGFVDEDSDHEHHVERPGRPASYVRVPIHLRLGQRSRSGQVDDMCVEAVHQDLVEGGVS